MRIAGFKKQSLIDYPGNISSVVFTQGCNFRCGFCHNPNLVLPDKYSSTYYESDILEYLTKYSKMLDAVCITGGEPTIQNNLPQFIAQVKDLGLKVKLDTNGTNPQMLKNLITGDLVDFIAMDIKHCLEFELYNKAVGDWINKATFSNILKSIDLIKNSRTNHLFRTTVAKGLHAMQDVRMLKKQFVKNYQIQNFNPEVVLNPQLELKPFSKDEYKELSF